MKRYSGQRALYEAMQRSGGRRKRAGLLERLTPQLEKVGKLARSVVEFRPKLKIRHRGPAKEKPASTAIKPPRPIERHEAPAKASPAQAWLKPKAVQFNGGRIEISLPWQLGVIIGLLVIVAVLVIYRLGQLDQRSNYATTDRARSGVAMQPVSPTRSAEPGNESSSPVNTDAETGTSNATRAAPPVAVAGDHVIVLAQYRTREDLEPVQEFFAKHGIGTLIYSFERLRTHFATKSHLNANVVPKGEGFMLLTERLVENPESAGTDGYALKQKIIELGAQYKAPRELESFARHHFSDAYGMKVQ